MTILVIDQEREGAQQVIFVTGELDLGSVDDLITAGMTAMADPTVHAVMVDLAGVEFIDSSGLSALVQLHNRARDNDRSFALRGATEQARNVLHLTALDTLLHIEDRVDRSQV